MSTFLAPIAKPKSLKLKLAYAYTRRQFGQVPEPLSVFCETAVLIREQVASTSGTSA